MGLLRHILLLSAFLLPGVLLAQEEADYDRSSLHIMMIKPLNAKYGDAVENVFRKMPFPERFNDHNLGVKCISFAETGKDQTHNLKVFIEKTNIAQKMVAKWFNRDKRTGSFNMELIKERGTYNANLGERMEARKSLRGLALLEDAGELLLNHTYLLVNDITYPSKGSGSWLFSTLAGNFGAIQNINGFQVTCFWVVLKNFGNHIFVVQQNVEHLLGVLDDAFQFFNVLVFGIEFFLQIESIILGA